MRRHPHVFGEVEADTPDAVVTNWEQIKKDEKGHASLVEGITPGLPSLIYVQKLLRKAASIGLAPDLPGVRAVGDEATGGRARGAVRRRRGARAGFDGESALTAWAVRFKDRFARMEEPRTRRAGRPPQTAAEARPGSNVRRAPDGPAASSCELSHPGGE